MFRNRSVDVHQFAMVPRAEIPRSAFRIQKGHKTTFDAGGLVPVYVDEVLPGDTFNLKMTIFARMSTPIFPIMDNLYLDSFFFFVPMRLVWSNWQRFMGERDPDPTSSIDYTIPQVVPVVGGWTIGSLGDYMGLPTVGQVGGAASVTHSALPLRAYNLIYNQWFRDENLQNSATINLGNGPDATGVYTVRKRGKRHDYFTSCLPWAEKGGVPVSLPIGSTAPVFTGAEHLTGAQTAITFRIASSGSFPASGSAFGSNGAGGTMGVNATPAGSWGNPMYPTNLYADLSAATAATVNELRQGFQIQKLLERDARGGTRYTEIVRAHFGVVSPDARLQRPEYLGGGTSMVNIAPVAQTSATSVDGSDTPLGELGAFGTVLGHGHGFTQSFTEHGYVIGIINVRADLTYQQGLRRMWSRTTRYDFYFPVFAMLGEQAVLNREIYADGSATDDDVFGYQERWAEYRYNPSMITSLFRSTAAGTLDAWHLAQEFSAVPTLNSTFIQETPPMERVLAVGAEANGQQFIADMFFDIKAARPLPMYSVPGLIDHF